MMPSSLPEPGALLAGKYRVERLLGRGGMGAVFAAQHEILKQRVAVKLLLGETAAHQEGLQRFINEARAAAQLDSEHITRVMDMGTLDNGLPFMVLEFLEGGDLGQLLTQRGALPVSDVVDYVLQACEALAQAHAAGIVHRDLKPSNLFLARKADGTERVKVLDFGISKVNDQSLTPKALTSTKAMLGTPYYMSPEQLVRPKQVDARTDVWQLGVTVYELLIGTPPFAGETLGELMFAIMNQPLPSITQARHDVPPALEHAIQRCLERDVNQRFSSVAELAAAIAPFGSGGHTHLIDRMTRTLGAKPPSFATTPAGGGTLNVQAGWPARATPQPGTAQAASQSYGSGPIPTGSGQGWRASGGMAPVGETGRSWGQASVPAAAPAPKSKAPIIVASAVVGVAVVGAAVFFARSRLQPSTTAVTTAPTVTAATAPASAPPSVSVAQPQPQPQPDTTPVTLTPPVESAPKAGTPVVDAGAEAGPKPKIGGWSPPPYRPPAHGGQGAGQQPSPATAPTRSPDQLPDNSRQ
jgi:serine/threonine-protein kinase